MEKLYSQIVSLPIVDEFSQSLYGKVKDILIDPDSGSVLGFLLKGNRVIVPYEVRRLGARLLIADEESIVPIEDMPRAQKVHLMKVSIVGNRVFAEGSNTFIGNVLDYEIDTTTLRLTKLHTAKRLFIFNFNERTITANNITRITKKGIFVKDKETLPVKEKVIVGSQPVAA